MSGEFKSIFIKILLALLFIAVLYWAFRAQIRAMKYKRLYAGLLGGVVATDNSFMVEVENCNMAKLEYYTPLSSYAARSCEVGLVQLILKTHYKANINVNGIFDASTRSLLSSVFAANGVAANLDALTLSQALQYLNHSKNAFS